MSCKNIPASKVCYGLSIGQLDSGYHLYIPIGVDNSCRHLKSMIGLPTRVNRFLGNLWNFNGEGGADKFWVFTLKYNRTQLGIFRIESGPR